MAKKIILLSVIVTIFFLSGCSWVYQLQSDADKYISDMTNLNLTVPHFEFVNQDGEKMSTDDLKGQVWVADMIFTRCPTVCGLMTPNMALLQDALIEEGLDVKLVSFTVDPEFDSPETLRKYGEGYGADFNHWMFVTGYTVDEIKQLSKETFLSVIEEMPESNDIIHATSFFVINEEGKVIRKYDGLNSDVDVYVKDLKKYLK